MNDPRDNDFQSMAVLIDADNTQLPKIESVLHELSAYGRIIVKKAYGNWKKQILSKWEDEIKRLAIKAEQQFDYVAGKNTTDIAMVIDAMDLLHTGMYDAVALVSSDSDFTPLAVRLRESGMYVIGVGRRRHLKRSAMPVMTSSILSISNHQSLRRRRRPRRRARSQRNRRMRSLTASMKRIMTPRTSMRSIRFCASHMRNTRMMTAS